MSDMFCIPQKLKKLFLFSPPQALTKYTEVEALEEAYVARFLALPQVTNCSLL